MIVFAAIIGLIAVYWFLGGLGLRATTYPIYGIFPTAQNLDRGAVVRMAGVEVGRVQSLSLTDRGRARVDMLIDRDVAIPADSVARITTGGFIGESYVEITPGTSRENLESGDRIAAEITAQPEQLMEQASELLAQLQTTAEGLNRLLTDEEMVAQFRQAIVSLNETVTSATRLMNRADTLLARTGPDIEAGMADFAEAMEMAVQLGEDLRAAIPRDLGPGLERLTQQARELLVEVDATVVEGRQLIAALQGTTARLDAALDTATSAAIRADATVENLREASVALRDLATDEELQQNLRTALENAAAATAELRALIQAVGARLGVVLPTPVDLTAIPAAGLSANALWNTGKGNYRFDADYTFPLGLQRFGRFGLYNIGENTRVNLQGGTILNRRNALRYGLYASRIGLGYDLRLRDNVMLSADLFRPNEPEMEVRGVFGLWEPWGVYAGVADVFDSDNRDVLLGIRYQR